MDELDVLVKDYNENPDELTWAALCDVLEERGDARAGPMRKAPGQAKALIERFAATDPEIVGHLERDRIHEPLVATRLSPVGLGECVIGGNPFFEACYEAVFRLASEADAGYLDELDGYIKAVASLCVDADGPGVWHMNVTDSESYCECPRSEEPGGGEVDVDDILRWQEFQHFRRSRQYQFNPMTCACHRVDPPLVADNDDLPDDGLPAGSTFDRLFDQAVDL